MSKVIKYCILAILLSSIVYTQQISKVLISGNGSQHDEDVKTLLSSVMQATMAVSLQAIYFYT